MQFPHLLTMELVATDDLIIPIAIAWTLNDGQYKSVYIRPEDAWLEALQEQASAMDISPDHLIEQGQSTLDIARELEQDLQQNELYCLDIDSHDQALEMIFSSINQEPSSQCQPLLQLFPGWSISEFEDRQRDMLDYLGISLATAEEQLLVIRALYVKEKTPHNPTAIWHLDDGREEAKD